MFKKYKKNRILGLFLTLVMIFTCVFSLVGCNSNKNGTENKNQTNTVIKYPLKIKDSYNRELVLEKEPKRIISIAPNITETIFALGRGNELVGRTDYCGYPEEVKKVQSIGSLTEPNVEKIVELKPDLVIASTHFKKEVLDKLEKLGIKVMVLYGENNFESVYNVIDKVGEAINSRKEATKLVLNMKKKVDYVTNKVKDAEKPKLYYVVSFGTGGDFTAGGNTFVGNMIEMAGGNNIAKDIKGWQYSIEKIVEKDPDIIICSKYFNIKSQIEKANGYKDLKAIKNKKLFKIDNNLLDRQGPRSADGLEELAKIIHPDLFK